MEKFLPIGIQDFEQMITGNFYYVDKTRYIHEMVRPPQAFYFLARPRRFGKSLTVSTLDYLFLNRSYCLIVCLTHSLVNLNNK